MKKTIIFISFIFLISCKSNNINWLDKETMDYSSLPNEVKKWIFKKDFKDLNEPNKYYLKTRQNKILPWVYHSDIYRKKDEKMFDTELNGEHGNHYIIYENYLFIPNHYNIYKADSSKYSFTRYRLE